MNGCGTSGPETQELKQTIRHQVCASVIQIQRYHSTQCPIHFLFKDISLKTRLRLSGSRPNLKMPRLSKLHQNEAEAAGAFPSIILCLKKERKSRGRALFFKEAECRSPPRSQHEGSTFVFEIVFNKGNVFRRCSFNKEPICRRSYTSSMCLRPLHSLHRGAGRPFGLRGQAIGASCTLGDSGSAASPPCRLSLLNR